MDEQLLNASFKGNLEQVKELLVDRTDPNFIDMYNQTPLFWTFRSC